MNPAETLPNTTAPAWPPLPLRRIVCGTDFSVAADRAAERAAQIALAHGATLSLVHIVAASLWDDASTRLAGLLGADVPPQEQVSADATERLRRLAARLDPDGRVRCEHVVQIGRPAVQLAQLAQSPPADLLVVADRGGHSLHDLVLGTTAQKLLRISPCPVLVVKRAPAAPYQRVLAPTDFSDASRAALRATAALLPQAALHIAHAFELPFDGIVRADISAAARQHYLDEAQRRLRADLHALADAAGIAALRRQLHVEHGYPATCIERWVDGLNADLVAVAAFGKSGLEHLFLGSVSLHTVSNAACDVLLLRGIE
jgi:nucleotide-binding universal stress UspA family protein